MVNIVLTDGDAFKNALSTISSIVKQTDVEFNTDGEINIITQDGGKSIILLVSLLEMFDPELLKNNIKMTFDIKSVLDAFKTKRFNDETELVISNKGDSIKLLFYSAKYTKTKIRHTIKLLTSSEDSTLFKVKSKLLDSKFSNVISFNNNQLSEIMKILSSYKNGKVSIDCDTKEGVVFKSSDIRGSCEYELDKNSQELKSLCITDKLSVSYDIDRFLKVCRVEKCVSNIKDISISFTDITQKKTMMLNVMFENEGYIKFFVASNYDNDYEDDEEFGDVESDSDCEVDSESED